MANDLLTVDMITREALRVAHQSMTFLGTINRQYDDQFANSPKVGNAIRIRKPPQYTVRTGAALAVQDSDEDALTLTVATRRGVDLVFSSEELALSIDDFSKRFIQPAVKRLVSNVEALVLQSLTKDVYNLVDNDGSAISLLNILRAQEKLDQNLAPMDGRRNALLSTNHQVVLVDALKGLFNDQSALASQYRSGRMGRTAGADFYTSTHVVDHTTGTAVKGDTTRNISGANQTGSTITVDTTGSTTFKAGDIVTLAGCNMVHPETKVDLGVAQQFVVTEDLGSAGTSLKISPAIVTSGGKQNVSASPTNGGAVTKVGAGASEKLNSSLVYHEDAFTFATVDLPLPDGVAFASRQVEDGVSLRIVRAYDINNDLFPCRIDILFGYLSLFPQWACRVHADG